MFAVTYICGNLFLRIAGKTEKSQKLEPAKILCHTVTCYLDALRKIEKIIQENAFEEKKKKLRLKFYKDKTG